ncbi:MAG: hypothetical protein Q4B14_05370 [Clostridia bacterium]|nr:hypothetical protein [Clostridia bacterium]
MKNKKMKKVFSMRLSSMLLVLSILTTCVAAGTFAASGDTLGMYGYAGVGYEFKVTLNGNESIVAKSDGSAYEPTEKAYWDIFSGKTTDKAVSKSEEKTDEAFNSTAVNQIGPGETVYGKIVVENAGVNSVILDENNSIIKLKAHKGTATDENLKVPFVVATAPALSSGADDIALNTGASWTTIAGTDDTTNNLKTYDIRSVLMATGVGDDVNSNIIRPGKKVAVWVKISWPTEGGDVDQDVNAAWTELYSDPGYDIASTVSDITATENAKAGFSAEVNVKATESTN